MSYKVIINESSNLTGLKTTKVVLVEGTNIGFSTVTEQTNKAIESANQAQDSAAAAQASAEHTELLLSTKVNLDGDIMTGVLTVPNVLLSSPQGSEPNAVVQKNSLDSTRTELEGSINLKSDLTYVDSELALKSDTTYVDSELALKANLSYTNEQLALKSDTTYVDSELALKANSADVNSDLTHINEQLALKANQTYVDEQLALKSDTTYVDSELALKANQTYVDEQLALKSDTTYVNSQLALKANTTYVDTQLNLKANKTDVTTSLALKADTIYVDDSISTLEASTRSKLDDKLDLTGGTVAGNIYLDAEQDSNVKAFASVYYVNSQITKIAGSPVLSSAWVALRSAMWNGYKPADGILLERALYPDAWAAISAGLVPVCTDQEWIADPTKRGCFTTGDGTSTFRIPDYNGKSVGSLGAAFMRGDGLNSSGVAGQIQGDAIRNIRGSIAANSGSTSVWLGVNAGSGALTPGGNSVPIKDLSSLPHETNRGGIVFDASLTVPTAADNRPVNVTGCWAIKLYGEIQNVGNISIDELADSTVRKIKPVQTMTLPTSGKKKDFPIISCGRHSNNPNWFLSGNTIRLLSLADLMMASTNGETNVVDYEWLNCFRFAVRVTVKAASRGIYNHVYSFDIDSCYQTNATDRFTYNHTFLCHAGYGVRANLVMRLVPATENNGNPYWELDFPSGVDLASAVDKGVEMNISAIRIWN